MGVGGTQPFSPSLQSKISPSGHCSQTKSTPEGQPSWKTPRRLSLNRHPEFGVSSHQMKPKIREFLTPSLLSPSSPSPDSGLPESLRDLWFHLYEVGKLLPCIGSGRSPILPISHLDHDTSFLNLVHLDTMASLLAKRVLFLHPTHWWGSYLESTDWWNYNPTWPSTAHHTDFANWPALPPRMDTRAPRDHISWQRCISFIPHLPYTVDITQSA